MARNLNENNLAGIEKLNLYNYVAEFIPLASSGLYVGIYVWYKEVLNLPFQMQIHTLRGNMPVY